MSLNLIVSGNIVTELSEKIPSNIIALNELIKNAYDANANIVTIKLDSKNQKLIISDDGDGMDEEDIGKLLLIGKSEKQYGKRRKNGRYTQGSKGLGFLSSFKFGKSKVVWDTYKNTNGKGIKFELDYKKIINSTNINQYKIVEMKSFKTSKGTEIKMDLDEYNLQSLSNYLKDDSNKQKILYSFIDDDFQININLDDKSDDNKKKKKITDIVTERQLFNIKYDSTYGKVQYLYDNHLLDEFDFKLSSTLYKLDLNICAFDLSKSKIENYNFPKLYVHDKKITPLIYINNNLFYNYSLFDVDILRRIKGSKALSQLLGKINIISDNKKMSFNSDRTNFSQNDLTDCIVHDLEMLNKQIQQNGKDVKSKYRIKNWLESNNVIKGNCEEHYRKYIIDDYIYKNNVKIVIKESEVSFESFGDERIIKPCKTIDLKNNDNKQARKNDSKDDLKSDDKNHHSKEDNNNLNDNNTSDKTNKNFNSGNTVQLHKVFKFPKNEKYKWNLDNILSNLVLELDKLYLDKNLTVITCCLRPIFELSIFNLKNNNNFINFLKNTKKTSESIEKILDKIESNRKKSLEKLSISTGMDFHDWENLLVKEDILKSYQKSNLGSHKASQYLDRSEVENIIKNATIFLIITNELLNNEELRNLIDWNE